MCIALIAFAARVKSKTCPQMINESSQALNKVSGLVFTSVLLFWCGYVAITLFVGFVTSSTISSEVLQLTIWGLTSSGGLLALTFLFRRIEGGSVTNLCLRVRASSLRNFLFGLLLGGVSFGIHVGVVATFAGPIRFEFVPGVGALTALVYFARFLSTSCMEELGFRGYSLRRLAPILGPWPAVWLTAVAFGMSHFLYGWDMQTIMLGVVPAGLLWGMSAIATRGIAVPIGLHAAWNFTSWSAGSRAETGLLQLVVEEEALELTQAVGMASYLSIFTLLTFAFWFIHRRNIARAVLTPTSLVAER